MSHQTESVVICGKLVDGTGAGAVGPVAVRLRSGVIEDVRAGGSFAAKGNVLDLSDYTIIPGFVDCHDHLDLDIEAEMSGSMETESLSWTTVTAVKNARLMVESGITTLRNVGTRPPVDLCVKRATEQGWIPGPRVLVGGAVGKTGAHGRYWAKIEADGPYEVLKAVRKQVYYGSDLIKLYATSGSAERKRNFAAGMAEPEPRDRDPLAPEMSKEEVDIAIEEAHRCGLKVAAHAHGGEGADWLIAAGVDSIEHGGLLSERQLKEMARKGIFLVLTNGVKTLLATTPTVPQSTRERALGSFDRFPEWMARIRRSGVRLAVGCDVNHGHPLVEIQAMVSGGFTPMEALIAATASGAELCGIERTVGTVQPGKVADLIALKGDILALEPVPWRVDTPIAPGVSVVAVISRGRLVVDNRC